MCIIKKMDEIIKILNLIQDNNVAIKSYSFCSTSKPLSYINIEGENALKILAYLDYLDCNIYYDDQWEDYDKSIMITVEIENYSIHIEIKIYHSSEPECYEALKNKFLEINKKIHNLPMPEKISRNDLEKLLDEYLFERREELNDL